MKINSIHRKLSAVAVVGVLSLSLAACGESDDDNTTVTPTDGNSAPADPGSETPTDETPTDEPGTVEGAASQVFGPGCADVPADGEEGSFNAMVKDPVATAASSNPLLSTLVTAVTEADLVDTLNTADGITVFAPANSAFEAIPEADLNGVLADKELLTKVLTHHVVAGELSPEELAGEHKTLAGDTITVKGSGEDFTVAGGLLGKDATVVCGNVPTANATVYIVDAVLAPAM